MAGSHSVQRTPRRQLAVNEGLLQRLDCFLRGLRHRLAGVDVPDKHERRVPTPRRAVSRQTLYFAAAAIIVASAAIAAASASERGVPDRYRYTGWMAPGRSASPRHITFEGDAPVLVFADSWNLTKTPVAYTVCITTASRQKEGCFNGTASTDTRNSVIALPDICCGDFKATWYIGGHGVAVWPFRYASEGA
jgi:hypothetical protein